MSSHKKIPIQSTEPTKEPPDLREAEITQLRDQVGILRKGLQDVIEGTDKWRSAGAQHAFMVIRATAENALIAAEIVEGDPSLVVDPDADVPHDR